MKDEPLRVPLLNRISLAMWYVPRQVLFLLFLLLTALVSPLLWVVDLVAPDAFDRFYARMTHGMQQTRERYVQHARRLSRLNMH